jgi:hypothetical protein
MQVQTQIQTCSCEHLDGLGHPATLVLGVDHIVLKEEKDEQEEQEKQEEQEQA